MVLKKQRKKSSLLLKKENLKLIKNIIYMISRNIIILLLASFISLACAKSNNEIKKISMKHTQNSTINNFENRPYYQINVKSSAVNFDIRVNDLPLLKFFEKSGGMNMEFPINTGILESGDQILTIKVYPLKDNNTILPNSYFSLELNKKIDAWSFNNKREIILKIPDMIVPKEGLPYWEFQTKFSVYVPYQLTGWKNSESIENTENIKKELNIAYEKIKNAIEKKDNSAFKLLVKNKIFEESVSLYEKQDHEITPFPEEKEKILPFTNCEIRFYGNGKLVRLEDNNGESCLKSEIIENGKSVIYTYPLFYHKPKNSSELEIIR